MAELRTFSLYDYDPSSGDAATNESSVPFSRPLSITVGTHALEPGVQDGKTLLRLAVWRNIRFADKAPKMRVKVTQWDDSPHSDAETIVVDDPHSVEIVFENATFTTEQKEMPFWLTEVLEFAVQALKDQYALNQRGLDKEAVG